jgi:hypothetical protein
MRAPCNGRDIGARRAKPAGSPHRPAVAPSMLAGALLLGVALIGCQRPTEALKPAASDAGAAPAAATSEAQRTREMERKAQDINRQADEIKNMQGSEQEKIDAVNRLDQQRQDLATQSGGGNPPAAQPPPQ